jgi:hypothetical protein
MKKVILVEQSSGRKVVQKYKYSKEASKYFICPMSHSNYDCNDSCMFFDIEEHLTTELKVLTEEERGDPPDYSYYQQVKIKAITCKGIPVAQLIE